MPDKPGRVLARYYFVELEKSDGAAKLRFASGNRGMPLVSGRPKVGAFPLAVEPDS